MTKKLEKIVAFFLICTVMLFMNITISEAISPSSQSTFEGIDVSNWQRFVDYAQVKNAGIEIVYIKSSEGTRYRDPYFEYNYANAKANGLKVGFYHFLTATNTQEAREQAQFFASVIAGKIPDCKLAMDFEQFRGGISVNEINDISKVFLETVQELTGKQVVIYSNLYDSERVFSMELANQYPLWIAYWGEESSLINSSTNWNTWEGWQYTSRGLVAGVNGYVDRNRFTENILLGECSNCPPVETPNTGEEAQTIYYTVKRGDTLSAIAARYQTTVQEIAKSNNIVNPNLIFPGQVLRITANAQENETSEMGHVVYTVKRGDNLWNIARKYGTTVATIAGLNGIRNPNLIYPGQSLRIPFFITSSEQRITYTVRRGDTLWRIARRYGVTVQHIVNLNHIQNPNRIYIGQILAI